MSRSGLIGALASTSYARRPPKEVNYSARSSRAGPADPVSRARGQVRADAGEKGLLEGRGGMTRAQLSRRALEAQLAAMDHRHAVAQFIDVRQRVGGEEYCPSRIPRFPQLVFEQRARLRIQAAG